MMRDLTPASDQSLSLGPMDDWARNLKTKGDADPFNPQHAQAIQRVAEAIRSGNISEEGVKNLANLTPKASFVLYDALAEYKKASTLQGTEKGILARNFGTQDQFGPTRPGETLIPVQKANYGQAIPELIGAGLTESAGKLAGIEKQIVNQFLTVFDYLRLPGAQLLINFH